MELLSPYSNDVNALLLFSCILSSFLHGCLLLRFLVLQFQSIYNFLEEKDLTEIESEVKNAAYEIINRKGATYYGIGMCLVMITNAILSDENRVITVSNYDKNNDIYMGTPAVVNKSGVSQRIYVELTDSETKKLQASVDVIKDAISKID